MGIFGAMAFLGYFAGWWLAFWLLMRKFGIISFLTFIPAALCSIGVPMIISELSQPTLKIFILIWFFVPFILIGIILPWSTFRKTRIETGRSGRRALRRENGRNLP